MYPKNRPKTVKLWWIFWLPSLKNLYLITLKRNYLEIFYGDKDRQ